MNVQVDLSLASLTSFKCGGPASFVITCTDVAQLENAIAFANEKALPWYVLGDGTNILASDTGYHGVIIRPRIQGVSYNSRTEDVLVTAGAGESWDALVRAVADKQLWGIENLAGIPGTVGASPVQNIGAYGVELRDSFVRAEVFNTQTGTREHVEREACVFGYRDSMFKQKKHLIILSVTLSLSHTPAPCLSYKDLQRAQAEGVALTTPKEIGEAVRAIRSRKFPDLRTHGTAGSFFKNPIISSQQLQTLVALYGDIPHFPHGAKVKIPLAYVLDTILKLRGHQLGRAQLFDAQPLVLVLDEGGASSDVETLARFVEGKVKEETNISIEREVQTL